MASSFSSIASGTFPAKNDYSSSLLLVSNRHYRSHSKVSFQLSLNPKFQFSIKVFQISCNRNFAVRAQHNDASFSKWFPLQDVFTDIGSFINKLLDPSVDTVIPSPTKDEVIEETNDPSSHVLASEEPISDEFISQVSNLVKLVDSKDITELRLKEMDFELLIRKKETIPIPTSFAPVQAIPAPVPPPINLSLTPAPKPSRSSIPPLKSPMAGTFYRSPAPGEPPFVKVGDKVQKGQILCIIEAMKLMNEIEADQSGSIVDIIAEDGKPVSLDTPLLVIKP